MSLASVAAQLAAGTGSAENAVSGAAVAAQASAGAAKVTDAVNVGTARVSGLFKSLTGEAQARTQTLLTGAPGSKTASAIPSDGTCCEECGTGFGMMQRRTTCTSCDRYFCGACLGRNPTASFIGFNCFRGSLCARCRSQNAQAGEFELCRHTLEQGASVMLGLPRKAGTGFFGTNAGSAARKFAAWLTLKSDDGILHWATLEQRAGRPLEEGQIPLSTIVAVKDTGALLELATTDTSDLITLQFSGGEDRSQWCGHIELAVQVLTPESERAALEEAKSAYRHKAIEERRTVNEERKKKLQEGLGGMRFTAEAMMSRNA